MKRHRLTRTDLNDSHIITPDILRSKVHEIESMMRNIIDSNGRWDDDAKLRAKIKELLTDRASYLDRMFLATPSEVSRLEALNDMLMKKVADMRYRAAMLWETMLTMRQMPEFDDEYEVRAELKVYGDRSDEGSILKLPEDEYYGSDFALANEAIVSTMPQYWTHAQCGQCISPWQTSTVREDFDQAFSPSVEDVQSWAEGVLRHPALDHICICYPIHDLVTHLSFSIPDLLRINHFTTKVWLEISNDTTQSGIRSFEKEFRSWKTDSEIDVAYKEWLANSKNSASLDSSF